LIRFSIWLTLIGLALWLGMRALLWSGAVEQAEVSAPILVLLWVFTVWSCWFVIRQPAIAFVRAYLITAVLRMLAVAGGAGVLIWSDPSGVMTNIIFLLVTYLVFMSAEIVFLMRKRAW
jgi:hypothetical protein